MTMRVCVLCEASGVVREAFRARGHDAWSCDLRPAEDGSAFHIESDAIEAIAVHGPWDLLIAHPPCTVLAGSGLHWNRRRPERGAATAAAVAFVHAIIAAAKMEDVPRLAIENPIGLLSTVLRPPDQIVQPYQFGHDASKATCLWLYGLPPLIAPRASYVAPRIVNGRPRWANQTDSGQNRLPPTPDRARLRSLTYPGIAVAMADQWGALPPRDASRTWTAVDLWPLLLEL